MSGDKTARSSYSENKTARSNYSEGSKMSSPRTHRPNAKQQKSRSENTKIIHETIGYIRRKVKNFKKVNLGPRAVFDYTACSKCLEEKVLTKWRIPIEKVKDYEEFLKLTLRKEVEDDVMGSDEYIDLITMSKRAQSFETLISGIKPIMMKCLKEQVYKSCDSLKDMSENEMIIAVSVYDNNITQHKLDIEDSLDEIDHTYKLYKQLLVPFSGFVREGEQHSEKMNKVCNEVLQLCKLVETWANEDDEYPDKLLEEFESNKKVKSNLQESILKIQAKKEENIDEMQKLKKSEVKAEKGYTDHRKDKVQLKTRKADLERKKKSLSTNIEQMRDEQASLQSKAEDLPKQYQYRYIDKIQALESRIEDLEKERKETEMSLARLERKLKPVQDKTYECKVDAVTYRHQREELVKNNLKLDNEVKSIRERMAKLDSYNHILVKIRDMKLSSEAYRRLKRDKQRRDAALIDGTQDLSDACKMAAPHIGKDWQKVYLRLPFEPPRDLEKRSRDLDILDNIAARNDIPWNDQALKSLDKWRSFHRRGNVQDLIQTLRTTKKRQIANEIENRFIVSNA